MSWQTYPTAFVVAGRSRERLVLVVATCPRCRLSHMHTAPLDFVSGRRKAPCGARYALHAPQQQERAA